MLFVCHGNKCRECGQYFTEDIPEKIPHARITCRAAEWIRSLLSKNMSVSAVAEITGIHWETVKKIHQGIMDEFLKKRKEERLRSGYKPTYLAVDEFAIHKGHSYATCVMDLKTGEILWVGKGRGMEDFKQFRKEPKKGGVLLLTKKAFRISVRKAVRLIRKVTFSSLCQKELRQLHHRCPHS